MNQFFLLFQECIEKFFKNMYMFYRFNDVLWVLKWDDRKIYQNLNDIIYDTTHFKTDSDLLEFEDEITSKKSKFCIHRLAEL